MSCQYCNATFRTAEDYRDHLPCSVGVRAEAKAKLIEAALNWCAWDKEFNWILSEEDKALHAAAEEYKKWNG